MPLFSRFDPDVGSVHGDSVGAGLGGLALVRLLELPGNPTGPRKITFVESLSTCPFSIERVYWLHNLHKNEIRGGHAHKQLSQLIVSLNGAFRLKLDDGKSKREYRLQVPDVALLVPPMIWREIIVLRPQSCLLVLASAAFDETDYIRDYDEFVRMAV
jgi:hypothetical protein